MKTFICILTLFIIVETRAQLIKPLSVGDKVPEWVMNMSFSTPRTKSQVRLDKRKLVILDFFSTWCGSCINLLPKMDSLQRQLIDCVQLVVVSTQSEKELNPLISANPNVKSNKLPLVMSDSILSSFFPYRYLPHEVWIYNGKVQAISDDRYVTVANIKTLLVDGHINLPVKEDVFGFDNKKPLYEFVDKDMLIRNSLFSKKLKGGPSGNSVQQEGDKKRRAFINRPLISLYQYASGIPFNRLFYDLSDSTYLDYNSPEHPAFCYEQTVPKYVSESQEKEWMLEDLNRLGPLKGYRQNMLTECFVIKSLPSGALCRTKGISRKAGSDEQKVNLIYSNVSMARIIGDLTSSLAPTDKLPLIDETGIQGNVDLIIPRTAYKDLSRLGEALATYGLTVTKEFREMERFVISDRKSAASTK